MIADIINYLKDPHLVARIQEFFGVRIHYNEIKKKKIDTNGDENHDCGKVKKGKNGYNDEISNGCCRDDTNERKKQSEGEDSEEKQLTSFTITNHFWYYLFVFGTELGDETFYSAFIPYWFWNVDGAVGRRVVLVWAIIMTVGQGLKEIIRWPRPSCPPAARLQSKWSQEYGMPSTHAMVGIAIPFSVLLFTTNRYIYSFPVGCTVATLWCALVSTSRLYLGMHTVLDVIVGLALAIAMMILLVPVVDFVDRYFVTENWALLMLLALTIIVVIYYPRSDRWTPTRGDTAMVVSVTAGVYVGAWASYKIGAMTESPFPPPYSIIWPSYPMLGHTVLRTIIGFSYVLGIRAICKSVSYATMCAMLGVSSKELMRSENSLKNKNKILVDLVNKYMSCFMIGCNAVYLLPNIFTILGIERPTFYTEI